jgi:hypothetical protein
LYIQSTFSQVGSFLIEGDRRYNFQTPHLSARSPRWYIIPPPFTTNPTFTATDFQGTWRVFQSQPFYSITGDQAWMADLNNQDTGSDQAFQVSALCADVTP